jgi:biotin carboxylase
MITTINKKCLLILGGGVDQIPGIEKAKEMGIYTIALDGNPQAKGKKYADEFHTVSIKHMQEIKKFIKTKLSKKVDGVIAFGVDIPSIIAQVADILNVNYTISQDAAKLSEDKFLAKEFMQQHNIAIPPYKLLNNITEINQFTTKYKLPIIMKPVDNSAARGISYIDSFNYIENHYNYALEFSESKKVQIEKYLSGPQISTESFIVNGQIHNIGFADRNYNDLENFLPNIIENGGDLPSIYIKEKHKEQLSRYLKIIADKLHIKNGIIKGDIVIHNDELYIIEFALRLSGGNFSGFQIEENTGIDFLKIAIKLHLNLPIDQDELLQNRNNILSIRYKFPEEAPKGVVKDIIAPKQPDTILLSKFHIQVGDTIPQKTTNHANRLGFAIASGKSREEAIQNAQSYLNSVEFVVE